MLRRWGKLVCGRKKNLPRWIFSLSSSAIIIKHTLVPGFLSQISCFIQFLLHKGLKHPLLFHWEIGEGWVGGCLPFISHPKSWPIRDFPSALCAHIGKVSSQVEWCGSTAIPLCFLGSAIFFSPSPIFYKSQRKRGRKHFGIWGWVGVGGLWCLQVQEKFIAPALQWRNPAAIRPTPRRKSSHFATLGK